MRIIQGELISMNITVLFWFLYNGDLVFEKMIIWKHNFRNHKSISDRTFTSGGGKTRLQEATLRILKKDECELLGAYKNEKDNKTVKVDFELELCAARISSRRLPEKWIKVSSDSKDEDKGGKISYKKAQDDGKLKTFFYGGLFYIIL